MRAWAYERKLEEGQGGEMARMCWEKIKGRARRGGVLGGWEQERKGFYEERGWTVEGVERMRGGGELRGEELVSVEKRLQEGDRWYAAVKGVGVPGYLKKGWGESRWRRVARFRLGSEMREGGDIGRMRRKGDVGFAGGGGNMGTCMGGMYGMERGKGLAGDGGEVLGDEGEGERWMRRVEEWRGVQDGGMNG